MKITLYECWKEDMELTRPYIIAYKSFTHVENFFVRLELQNGLYGLGSGAPAEIVTGEKFGKSYTFLQSNGSEYTVGKDIRSFRTIINSLTPSFTPFPAARAALEMALYDLYCKYIDIPLFRYLGGSGTEMETSVTIGIMNLKETLEEVKACVGRGFHIIKLKTGQSVEEDIERCFKIRESFDSSLRIHVDANQGYSLEDLRRFTDASRSLHIEFCEQPLPAGYLNEMRKLQKNVRLWCVADEDIHSPGHALELIQEPFPFGIFNIKLMKCGGITPALLISRIAEQKEIDLMWGCMDESKISIAAALHAAMSTSATRYLDLDGNFDLARDIVTGGYILKDGKLYLTEKPGLGVQLK